MVNFGPRHLSPQEERFREKIRQRLRPAIDIIHHPTNLIEHWIKAFSSNNFEYVCQEAEIDLTKYKEESLPLLIRASDSQDLWAQYWAVYYLARIADPRAKDILKQFLEIRPTWYRTEIDAAEGLYRIGEKELSIRYLVSSFLNKDEDRDKRMRSAERLLHLGIKRVIPSNAKLNLENVPAYLHKKFQKFFQKLS